MLKRILFLFLILVALLIPRPAMAANTWVTTTITGASPSFYSAMTLDTDGFARIVYKDGTSDDLKFIRCMNESCSSSEISTVDSTGDVGSYPSIAMGRDGFARIAYYDGTNADLKYAQCTNPDCSSSITTTVDSSVATVGWFTSIAVGSDGYARISYSAFTGFDLKMAQCTNDSCSTNVKTIVDSAQVGYYSSIKMAPDGFARISYYDDFANLKFVQCTNAACSTSVITTVETVDNTGQHTSLAIGSDGFGRISYYDITNSRVKYVQCLDAACSTSVINPIDSSTASSTSIALGSDGFARISYQGSDNDLKFAQCNNASCSNITITNVDSAGNVGSSSSLGINSAGLVKIAYLDSTNSKIKLAIQVPESSGGASASSAPAASPPSCTNSLPSGSPDLFQINATNNQATLYFAPTGNTTGYVISFGYTPGDNRFGASFNLNSSSGVVPYTINFLAPNTLYYFTVRAQNGCMPGSWSNSLGVKTTRKGSLVNKAFRSN